MAKLEAKVNWTEGLALEGHIRGHKFAMDASEASGGKNTGPSPKEMALAGLAGCSVMDVALILKKMRWPLEKCEVYVETGLTEGQPSVFDQVKMVFEIVGGNDNLDKIKQAVELSMTKYCGVGAMIVKTTDIHYEVNLNGTKKVLEGQAKF